MDKIEVSQRAREKAWAVRPECYCEQDRTKWMAGVYDHVRIIQAFARFERDILATRTDATPSHWSYSDGETEFIVNKRQNPKHYPYCTETPLYTHPPATDVAALVKAAKASAEGWANVVEFNLLPVQQWQNANDLQRQLRQALAPFTKGQNDE